MAVVLVVVELLCTGRVPFAYLTTDVLSSAFAVLFMAVAAMDGTRSLVARALQLGPGSSKSRRVARSRARRGP